MNQMLSDFATIFTLSVPLFTIYRELFRFIFNHVMLIQPTSILVCCFATEYL